jgi:hypothetical protein
MFLLGYPVSPRPLFPFARTRPESFETRSTNPVKTFTKAVEEFLKDAESWVSPEDFPAVVALQHMAAQLDKEITGPILAQYGLAYRNLLKRKPATAPVEDELQRLLNAADDQMTPMDD